MPEPVGALVGLLGGAGGGYVSAFLKGVVVWLRGWDGSRGSEVGLQAALGAGAVDLIVQVARAGHLIALKLLARDDDHRPQDSVDLRALVVVADEDERALAATAANRSPGGGFARGRDWPQRYTSC